MVHLTEKPVELAAWAMQYSSRSDENVLDFFGGSGSTLIAAEQTERKAFLFAISLIAGISYLTPTTGHCEKWGLMH